MMDIVDFSAFTGSAVFQLVVIPILIFFARVVDVSLGTLRTVFVAQGIRVWAAVLGFFEVLIWLIAISYILQNLTGVYTYLAYASGFGAGNYFGLWLEEKLAHGMLAVTTITNRDARPLIEHLKKEKFGLTSVSARGAKGNVRLILTIIRRKNLKKLQSIIESFNPHAFIAVQPVKAVSREITTQIKNQRQNSDIFAWRKGK
jgi:uncharacterized protein YebE (UPF0316 family)